MGNKKQLKEGLNRFNSIMGYNPSKGTIKEEGEQMSMDFPIEHDEIEGRILTNGNKVIETLKSRPSWLPSYYLRTFENGKVDDYSLRNTLTGLERNMYNYKRDLDQGRLKKMGKTDYDNNNRSNQKSLGLYDQEINNFNVFFDLVKDVLADMRSIGLDYDYTESLSQMIQDYDRRIPTNSKNNVVD